MLRNGMRILLVLATIIDLGIGVLFIAVSGFVLQGVNNTGPESMPTAVGFVAFVILCFAAPVAAWALRGRLPAAAVQAIVWSPVAVVALVSMLEPLFT